MSDHGTDDVACDWQATWTYINGTRTTATFRDLTESQVRTIILMHQHSERGAEDITLKRVTD